MGVNLDKRAAIGLKSGPFLRVLGYVYTSAFSF